MLIRFTVANCLSFNDKTSLEMFASKERNLKEQLWTSKSRHLPNILKAAFIFGPNAAGKSNLIKALHFAKSFVLGEPNPLGKRTLHFKLCPECSAKPSFFEFEFLVQGQIYRYGFELHGSGIVREWLYKANSTGEHLIFERSYDRQTKNALRSGEKYPQYQNDVFIHFLLKGTPENKLFLTESIDRNLDDFREVYDWFRRIVVIYPDTELQSYNLLLNNDFLLEEYRRLMKLCDLGIDGLLVKPVDADEVMNQIPLPIQNMFKAELLKNLTVKLSDRYTVSFQEDAKEAHLIQISHKMPLTGENVKFDIAEESDGTNRLFDLIPILTLILQDAIILVDELDRSLHPMISRSFIKAVFNANLKQQAQMIVTTHDATLLDVQLLRRDSIWFVRRNFKMESDLYSLNEFVTVRNDKALQKAYLAGLYGAVPMIKDERD